MRRCSTELPPCQLADASTAMLGGDPTEEQAGNGVRTGLLCWHPASENPPGRLTHERTGWKKVQTKTACDWALLASLRLPVSHTAPPTCGLAAAGVSRTGTYKLGPELAAPPWSHRRKEERVPWYFHPPRFRAMTLPTLGVPT